MILAENKIIYLTKENQINKVLREQKKNKSKIKILFTSLWDKWSERLLETVADYHCQTGLKDLEGTLYIVDSFNMPHSYVIFGIKNVPALVSIDQDSISVENYLPMIYKGLGLN